MNIFRLCGDMLHLLSIVLLLLKLLKSKSCVGVSCRMQEMYALVFIFRYLDLLWSFISVYNSVMKVVFIISTCYLVYLMRVKPPVSQTYDRNADSFQYEKYLLPPALLLGFIFAEDDQQRGFSAPPLAKSRTQVQISSATQVKLRC